MYFILFLLVGILNISNGYENITLKQNYPPVINYYTNIIKILLNGTNHSIEFIENEINKIDRHSVGCDNLFNILLSEQHSYTWNNYDDVFLSKLLQSMIEISYHFDDVPNSFNIKNNNSNHINDIVGYFSVDKICGQLFDNWLNKLHIDTEKYSNHDLYTKFFISMIVFKEHMVNKNIENILSNKLNESIELINNKIQKIFYTCKKCGKLYEILLVNKNLTMTNNFRDNLLISRFLISMIILNKNMKYIGERKFKGTYQLNDVNLEKDMIHPIIFLNDLQKNNYNNDQDFIFDLKKSLKSMSILHQNLKEHKNMECNNELSIHQLLYSTYNCISLTAFNSYSMILYAYKAYSPIIQHNFSTFMTEEKHGEFLNTMLIIGNQSADAMENKTKFIRRCDPDNYQEGVNYEKFKYFLHTNIIGLDYISRIFEPKIYETCSNVPSFKASYDRFKCNGMIHNCKFFDVDKICFSNNSDHSRHYQSFKTKKGEVIGQWTSNCTGNNVVNYQYVSQVTSHDFSVTGILTGSPKLTKTWDTCACTCDDISNKNTVRYFSLQEVRAKNHQGVVTGIKFGNDNGVLVLNIRVGIFDNYVVNSTIQGWNSSFVLRTNKGGNQSNDEIEYVGLHYNYRNFLLNNVAGPPGTVVQGVRFNNCQEGISIDVLATKINNEGELLKETSTWYSACDNKSKREEIKIPENADVPTATNLTNKFLNKENAFVKFQLTDWISDASQTVVPFFDTQEIITNPSAPLSGIGTFYKSHNKSGGFIALQLLTFDYNQLMTSQYITYNLEKLSKNTSKPIV